MTLCCVSGPYDHSVTTAADQRVVVTWDNGVARQAPGKTYHHLWHRLIASALRWPRWLFYEDLCLRIHCGTPFRSNTGPSGGTGVRLSLFIWQPDFNALEQSIENIPNILSLEHSQKCIFSVVNFLEILVFFITLTFQLQTVVAKRLGQSRPLEGHNLQECSEPFKLLW